MSSKAKTQNGRSRSASLFRIAAVFLCVCLFSGGKSQAQSAFSSGSTGHEGALNITAAGVTYFDPVAMNLNPVVPGIFNFTTINVASGSTLKFSENKYHGSVYFLASGDVTIAGTLDLSGEASYGSLASTNQSQRIPNAAGSGGFSGGIGGFGSTNLPALPGNGPGGGAAGTSSGGTSGTNPSNQFLVPLMGGSGGGGHYSNGAIGGAGGGAILIASSTTIYVSGTINANGRTGFISSSGVGAGGAVRLVATTIQAGGTVDVRYGGSVTASSGVARFESNNLGGPTNIYGAYSKSVPYALNLPSTPTPSIKVAILNGQEINANPFTFPDVTLTGGSQVPITVEARYVPVGTVAKIYIFSEAGPDQVINIGPLTGNDYTLTTAFTTITYPPGGSRGYVKATW